MRHGVAFNGLNRTMSHRRALLRNLTEQILEKERIMTTVAKAKRVQRNIEEVLL